ncbi:MAG: hypothetical protein COS85_22640 [Armatimonadetes bacterium CG07_land_8_20_14_0_80_59_28]|nr:MAG: hypothetical protein COS85_22640 [Armatimonadetes bacterium CG07_land_8_20_14_0_80_59_28]PIX44388.1 MAG: hypothetical protein COZ56_04640 [Armatimonadetes bacterium CG_4_8_14_3_um_filter_58_9]PIY42004.1 MAG: hypothetical protein COZ05_14730 [Armatimonadetes bacterium CG_4_10_14_3_um_filter_59_10]
MIRDAESPCQTVDRATAIHYCHYRRMEMRDTVRLGITGLGSWARRAYLPNIKRMGDVEIAALCTRSRANMDVALKLVGGTPRQFDSHSEMLSWGELDGVIVATAACSHRAVVEAVLQAGLPVLCAKPLATTVAVLKTPERHTAPGGVFGEFRLREKA